MSDEENIELDLDGWLSNPDSPKTCPECSSDDVAKLLYTGGHEEMRRWVLNRCRDCRHSF
jgi:hypothetical protein